MSVKADRNMVPECVKIFKFRVKRGIFVLRHSGTMFLCGIMWDYAGFLWIIPDYAGISMIQPDSARFGFLYIM